MQERWGTYEGEMTKPPISGYLLFLKRYRDTIRARFPELLQQEIVYYAGTLWSQKSEEEKAVYIKLADEAKKRYRENCERTNVEQSQVVLNKIEKLSSEEIEKRKETLIANIRCKRTAYSVK